MADIVNLNRARKKKRAAEKDKIAETNRAKFGRTKAEKSRNAFERDKAERAINGAKRDEE